MGIHYILIMNIGNDIFALLRCYAAYIGNYTASAFMMGPIIVPKRRCQKSEDLIYTAGEA